MNETTDAAGNSVGNVLVGKLDNDGYTPPYLVNCVFMEKTDSAHVARLINNTLRMLFPNFDADLAKIIVSDAAPYMVKAAADLKIFFPSLVHITCFAHGMHRVCEKVREMFANVNGLISCTKKIFLKSPLRRATYKECCPNLAFPPEPVITR